MAAAKILELIDKVDTYELVRDEIAAILVVESANQQVRAPLALPPQDARLYKLRVFIERTDPWPEFKDAQDYLDATPIVNVWFDESSIDLKRSNLVERQCTEGTFNLDVYACGISEASGASHIPGDERAARARDRAVRLARNILMGGAYTYLGMRGIVARRYFQSIKTFQPQLDDRAAQRIHAARLALRVEFNEFSPQVKGQPFETLHVDVKRKETGELYLAAKYGV